MHFFRFYFASTKKIKKKIRLDLQRKAEKKSVRVTQSRCGGLLEYVGGLRRGGGSLLMGATRATLLCGGLIKKTLPVALGGGGLRRRRKVPDETQQVMHSGL